MLKIKNYIDGRRCEPASAAWRDNFDPATGEVFSQVPESSEADLASAIQSAQAAFPAWASQPASERARVLNRIADLVEENLDQLAELESRDNGKPVTLARQVDIPRVATNFRFFAALSQTWASEMHPMADGFNMTYRDPLGVVACISPWNLPLYLFSWKIAPALAVGNCVIGKPSEVTPASADLLAQLCQQAELPAGVLSILHGTGQGIGRALANHRAIKAVSFTGSTRTGQQLASELSPQFKKLSLELGGKNPNLIFADCDFKKAVETSIRAAFSNQGQICLCGSRIYIERSIYDRFRDEFVNKAKQLRVGDPLDPANQLGAVVSQEHYQKIMGCVQLARDEGGKILCGGQPAKPEGRCANGWFIQPTVIEGLDTNCRTNQEEIFGPVVSLQPFDTESEVIELANNTQYGLSATIWTRDVDRAHRVSRQLDCGVIWVNCWLLRDLRTPFGGEKSSGQGREGGLEAFRFFTRTKNVCLQVQPHDPA